MGEATETKSLPASSCVVRESGIVNANVEDVWNYVKTLDFRWRMSENDVLNCECELPEVLAVNVTRMLTFAGDVFQTYSIGAINSYDHSASWDLVASDPPVEYSSARYSVKLEPVTMTNQTLIIFTSVYSNDAKITVTE